MATPGNVRTGVPPSVVAALRPAACDWNNLLQDTEKIFTPEACRQTSRDGCRHTHATAIYADIGTLDTLATARRRTVAMLPR